MYIFAGLNIIFHSSSSLRALVGKVSKIYDLLSPAYTLISYPTIRFQYYIPPRSEGVIKNWKFSKFVIEPKVLKMIFRAQKKRAKSKRWPMYLKHWASYGIFCRSRCNKISSSYNFQISISQWILELWAYIFCMWS